MKKSILTAVLSVLTLVLLLTSGGCAAQGPAAPSASPSGQASSVTSISTAVQPAAPTVKTPSPSSTAAQNASASPSVSPSGSVTTGPDVSAAKDYYAIGADLMQTDGMGSIKVNMTDADLTKLLGQPDAKTPPTLWAADGLEHSNWSYGKQGLAINMARQPGSTDSIVFSVTAEAPCALATKRGVKIGTPKAQVLSAYADAIDPEANKGKDTQIVIGAVYGGIVIDIANGAVVKIFIGAAAE